MHCALYLSQFVLGLRQCSLFLCQLRHGSIQLGPLWLYHPVDTPIHLEEKWSYPLISVSAASIFMLSVHNYIYTVYESTFLYLCDCELTLLYLHSSDPHAQGFGSQGNFADNIWLEVYLPTVSADLFQHTVRYIVLVKVNQSFDEVGLTCQKHIQVTQAK